MADFSDYLENAILNTFFRNQAFTPAAGAFLALYTAAPTDAGGGTEVSGSGYARKPITFGAASSGAISNTAAVEFTATGGNFGNITHVGIFNAATGGNLLAWKAITPITINNGDTISFPIGDIDVTQD